MMANLRNTSQKDVILNALSKLNHPTADELLSEIIKEEGSFSKATLYRNLAKFIEDGLVEKVYLEEDAVRYEISKGFHYHLICTKCGRVDNLVLPKPLSLPAKLLGYEIEGHTLIFKGVCPNCQNK